LRLRDPFGVPSWMFVFLVPNYTGFWSPGFFIFLFLNRLRLVFCTKPPSIRFTSTFFHPPPGELHFVFKLVILPVFWKLFFSRTGAISLIPQVLTFPVLLLPALVVVSTTGTLEYFPVCFECVWNFSPPQRASTFPKFNRRCFYSS